MQMINKQALEGKLLKTLDVWAVHYMTIGMGNHESPRWAQLMTVDGKFCLKSTQCTIQYYVDLTKDEEEYIRYMESDRRWSWFRQLRNNHLATNFKTIEL